MRHYEVMFLVHPDRSDQVPEMTQRYVQLIQSGKGHIHRLEHRLEDFRKELAYPIHKLHKVHYVLMNIECQKQVLEELKESFQFNDAVLRHLVLKQGQAITEPSIFAKAKTDRDHPRDASPPQRTEVVHVWKDENNSNAS